MKNEYQTATKAITTDILRGVKALLQEAGMNSVISIPPEALDIRIRDEDGKVALVFQATSRIEPRKNSRIVINAEDKLGSGLGRFEDAFAQMQYAPVDPFIQAMLKNAKKLGVKFGDGNEALHDREKFLADDVETLRALVTQTAAELALPTKPGKKATSHAASTRKG